MSKVEEIGNRYEELTIATNTELFRQIAGLPYDREKLEKTRKEMTNLCEDFLNQYTRPRLMYLTAFNSLAQAARIPHRLKLSEQRLKHISTSKHHFKGQPVTWASWRQFNAVTESSQERKEVFDHFITQAPKLVPFIQDGFEAMREVYLKYDRTPLDNYLELEGISYSNLTNSIHKLGEGAKTPFSKVMAHYINEVKDGSFEYYDDFYFLRGKIYQPLNKHLKSFNIINEVNKVLHHLGFNIDRIKVDSEDRPKKSPSAFCYAIQVPNDIRVVYKDVSPGTDLGSVFHEFGHGIHGISGNPDDPPWKRYVIPRSVAETFSFLIESLITNPLFLHEDLKLPQEVTQEIVNRRLFMQLYFAVFYSANSLMKLSFWKDNLTYAKASDVWQQLTRKFYLEIPGDYWLLHHIMSDYDIYAPSYILAAIRVLDLQKQLQKQFGDRWWHSPEAGTFITELAASRGEFPIHKFSLDPNLLLKEMSRISFL
ncbi:MAG: M3 family metallopeptidase [Candidatus Ranarchaeia archaeon]|jgi:hypothetical protein